MDRRGPSPFEEYKIYGPYLSKTEQRRIVVLYKSDKTRTSISYARYLLSIKLGRLLTDNEEADHIDGDKLNDSIDNLQVLSVKANRQKSATTGRTMLELTCDNCMERYKRERRQVIYKRSKNNFCSRTCARHFQFHGPLTPQSHKL